MQDKAQEATLEQLRGELQLGVSELDRGEGIPLEDLREELGLTLEPPNIGFGRSV
jgi:hypothetical protein